MLLHFPQGPGAVKHKENLIQLNHLSSSKSSYCAHQNNSSNLANQAGDIHIIAGKKLAGRIFPSNQILVK
jgi:hypothetical protein